MITENIKLFNGDCLELFKNIPDGSVDAVICDPPYGTTCGVTAKNWDSVIPFDLMWGELNRIIKPNGVIVLFGSEPFSSALRMSNIENYKYDWIWEKNLRTGHLNAKHQPMRSVENVSVFYGVNSTYNPQDIKVLQKLKKRGSVAKTNNVCGLSNIQSHTNYPHQLLKFKRDSVSLHPTQKPVKLMEYLVKTYTNENDVVVDFTYGSCTTGVACIKTKRKFIGFEISEEYFNIGVNRIKEAIVEVKRKEHEVKQIPNLMDMFTKHK